MSSSSFTTSKLNGTTFLIVEDDVYREHPYIYAKVHPSSPILVLSDTGCDEPSSSRKHDRYIHLREYLEKCPLECNNGSPLNPDGKRTYVILCTHCHFDHTGGIMQFLRGGNTQIVASAAGRDFIESDLAGHGLYDLLGRPTPYYKVTHWARAFERLHWPLKSGETSCSDPSDLGITMLQTPGHTPDELAWYDHDEMHLYVGDSFYEEGVDRMPTIWPLQGNLIEWSYSIEKLQQFVKSENLRAAEASEDAEDSEWVSVASRVKLGCGHTTAAIDAEEVLTRLKDFWTRVLSGEVPVIGTSKLLGEVVDLWAEPDRVSRFSFQAPRKMMVEARRFFNCTGA